MSRVAGSDFRSWSTSQPFRCGIVMSSVMPRVAAVQLAELLEDQIELVRGDTDARVRHGEGHVVTPTGDGHGDRPLVRELDGVAQEVDEDLLDLVLVGVEPRQVRVDRL